jgi:hypothetical protein
LTATAAAHYHFVNWTGDVPSGHETDNPLPLLMDGDKTLTANFAITSHTITASADPGGTISPTGIVPVSDGDTVQFTVQADGGFIIDTLFVDGLYTDSTTSYTFYNVTASHTIHATFLQTVFTITASASSGGTIDPAGDVSVNRGASQQFSVATQTGYHLASLFVDGTHVDSTTSYTFTNVLANHTIHADFAIDTFTVVATAGSGGTISPSGTVAVTYGADQQFTITPNTGYRIDSLFVDGVHSDSTTSYTFYNVTASHTIHATFTHLQLTITATAGSGGSISPSGSVQVIFGDSQRFVVTADSSHIIDTLFVDGVHVDSTTSYTFTDVQTNHTIHATFAVRTFTIVATVVGEGGTITPSGTVVVNYGDSASFTMHPNDGYQVDSVFVDGVFATSDTVYTFEDVTANHTIDVTFRMVEGVVENGQRIPKEYALYQNYPNPFNPSTVVPFDLPQQSTVTLTLYNVLGKEVAVLIDHKLIEAGVQAARFNAASLASGVYIYRLTADGVNGKQFSSVRKMMLLK